MIHENIELTGSLEISGSFIIPLGGDNDREGSPITGSLFFNTSSNALETYNGNAWVTQSGGSGGGEDASSAVEYLVVAGGGGGGGWGGGGGAGGLLSSSFSSLTSGSSYAITVGAGGARAVNRTTGAYMAGSTGTNSSISGTGITTVTSTAGGGGGAYSGASPHVNGHGADGGSGGGAGIPEHNVALSNTTPGDGTSGQGFSGGGPGDSFSSTQRYGGGGGGGGASEAGADGNDWTSANSGVGGVGGDGKTSNITGTATTYAGGGGGFTSTQEGSGTNARVSGGSGGGGAGGWYESSTNAATGIDGTANTGGGGGSGNSNQNLNNPNAGAGGSGVVILAYNSSSIHAAGGISGDAGNGRRYHQFNTSDTFKVGATTDFNIVTEDLVLHLDAGDFDSRGTSTWSDLSGNGYDSTLVSSPTLGQNFYYEFDGSADYGTFSSAAHTAISSHTQGTIECWVNGDSFTSGTGRKTIFGAGHSSQTDRWCIIRVHQNNYLQMSINSDGTSTGCNTTTSLPSTNTWYHLVITYNGSSFAAYYDGVSQTINTSGGGWFSSVGSNTIQVGALDRGSNGNFI